MLAGIVFGSLALAGLGVSLSQERSSRSASLIITAASVVTLDPERRVLSPGSVVVDGRTIVAVDRPEVVRQTYTAVDVIDVPHGVVLPGLINTHTHAPMVLYRGLADDLALMDWLQRYMFPAEAKTVSPEFVRTGTRLAALEMIQSGTTTFTDMYYFEEEIAKSAREAGLRGVLGQTVIGMPVSDAPTPADALARAEAFIKAFSSDELIVPAVAPHALYSLERDMLMASRALADRYRVPLLIHLAESRDEVTIIQGRYERSSVAYLDSIGFWKPGTLAAHAIWVSDEDIETLRRARTGIAHNPESNMKLASGTAPVPKFLAAGVPVGLGTDGAASNNDLDMFEAMRQAAFLHKLMTGNPRSIPAAVALEMATLGGARALGLDSLIGSLEAGKRADIIVVAMDGARQTPMYDPISHLVYIARGADVRTTVVNGRVLMRDRKMLTLDEQSVLAAARGMADRVWQAVEKK